MAITVTNTDAGLSGKTLATTDTAQTITALKTFSRSTNAPFAVNSGAAAVANLDADKLDGVEGSSYARSDAADTISGALTFDTADATFNDNVKVTLGTGGDADLYYDGTDVHLDPKVVGSGKVVVDGEMTAEAGTGTQTYAPAGRVSTTTTNTATSGTSEEVLATYTIPANTLDVNGKSLRVMAYLRTAANGNNKVARLRLGGVGGTVLVTTGTITLNDKTIVLQGWVIRTGASSQDVVGTAQTDSATVVSETTASADLTGTVALVVTGETSGASGDLTSKGMVVEYLG